MVSVPGATLTVVRGFGAVLLLLFACSDPVVGPESFGPPMRSQGLGACVNDSIDGTPRDKARCVTHRAIAGVSMGGGAATRIALESPELFDVVGSLGSPYIDLEYFLLSVAGVSNGGFCPREQLLANLDKIDLADDPATWCGPVVYDELALPDSACTGGEGDFNHHYRGTPAGRGGSFNREGSFEIVQDFALAFGNPAFYSPSSPYFPPGTSADHHVALSLDGVPRQQRRSQICANPARLTGVYDREFNPDGSYPVITFCDGNGPVNGVYVPGTQALPVEVTLSVDYNDNGRRDYGEPVLAQPFEPYDDFGADGLPNPMEPGYDPARAPDPAADDYHWLRNPTGTEANFRWDAGERFDDVGLDGVLDTMDHGEANGTHDENPNIVYAFSRSPRRLVERVDARMLDRLHVWVDAGIRDFLFSAQITNQFFGALMHRHDDARLFTDWRGLAAATMPPGEDYDPNVADLSAEAVGRHAYLRYGDPSICPGLDDVNGRGNHVGPAKEILDRLLTSLAFASARLEGGDFVSLPGALADQGGPTGSLDDYVQVKQFNSPALGRVQPYVVVLPPDYYATTDRRYPVVYFLHGQGQKATDLAASALLFLGPQMTSQDRDRVRSRRADWQKMIIVFADGECQLGECHTGTFYVDFKGVDGRGARHGEAFFELMREVDATLRTKHPEMLLD